MVTSEKKISEIRQPDRPADKPTDDKLHIFVSHKVIDRKLAEGIQKKLVKFGGKKRMEIFLSEQIPFGVQWPQKIHEKLKKADWLIFIYTDPSREWDWCLYETGFFAGKTQTDISKRLVCLYSGNAEEIPAPLQGWQAVGAKTDNIKELLKQIYSQEPRPGIHAVRPDAIDEDSSEWLTETAESIAKALRPAPKTQCYSEYLTLALYETELKQFSENGEKSIPDSAIIDGDFDDNALELFDLNRGKFSWSEFSKTLRAQEQDVWISDLCRQLSIIIPDKRKIHQHSLPTFISARGHAFYVPIIHRKEQIVGSELKLWLLFLPTANPPEQEISHTHPYIRLVYGGDAQVVAASEEAKKLFGQPSLEGTSLLELVDILTRHMIESQKTAFTAEQLRLIADLVGGSKTLNAEVCVVFTEQPDRAYLPLITKYFTLQNEKYIDVCYLDVSNIAEATKDGVKICKLL